VVKKKRKRKKKKQSDKFLAIVFQASAQLCLFPFVLYLMMVGLWEGEESPQPERIEEIHQHRIESCLY
jgi:hypothetical protein